MGFVAYNTSGHELYNKKEYVIDEESDVLKLPIDIPAGSTAICTATSEVYMLNTKKKWIKL